MIVLTAVYLKYFDAWDKGRWKITNRILTNNKNEKGLQQRRGKEIKVRKG
jgi:hypothetical protein